MHRLALPAPPPWPPTQQSWSAALHSRPSPRWRASLAETPLLGWCDGCGPRLPSWLSGAVRGSPDAPPPRRGRAPPTALPRTGGDEQGAAVGRMSWTVCYGPTAPMGAPLPAPLRCTPGPAGGGRPQWHSDSLCSPANQGNQPVHMPRPWRTLGPKRPASLGSGTRLGRAVLPKTQPRTQSRGAPALPHPVRTVREHTRRGWHTSGLSEALRGCEPAGRGLPSSPQGGGP